MELLVFFLLLFALTFVWRSVQVFRLTGVNPLVLPSSDDAYGYVGRAFKLVMLAIAGLVVLHAAVPQVVQATGQFDWLSSPTFRAAGWLVLIICAVWLFFAQLNMGSAWRIGIDKQRATPLVTGGLFHISRNPIFLAMRLSLLGLFLVLPHAASLAIAVAGELLMQVQVRLEEQHLKGLHGQAYLDYCGRVRRWI